MGCIFVKPKYASNSLAKNTLFGVADVGACSAVIMYPFFDALTTPLKFCVFTQALQF